MSNKHILLFLLFCCCGPLSAQDWQYYHGNTRVNDLAFEKDTLWVATNDGLEKRLLSGEVLHRYYTTNSPLHSNAISCVAVDTLGNKWLGTYDDGLYRFSPQGQWTHFDPFNSGLAGLYITAVAARSDSTVWVGSLSINSVARYDGSAWTVFNQQNSALPIGNTLSIGIDGDSTWVGTENKGVTLFANDSSTYYEAIGFTNIYHVRDFAFLTDTFGQHFVWMFADGGVIRYGPGAWGCHNFAFSDGADNQDFYAGEIEPGTTTVWAAGNKGLVRGEKNGQFWQEIPLDDVADIGFITADLRPADSLFFFGAYRSLLRHDLDTLQVLGTANTPELSSAGVSYLFVDDDDTAWFGCYDGLICRYRNNEWTAYDVLKNNEFSGWVTHIGKINGQVWASTDNGGIAFFDGNAWSLVQSIPNAPWQCFLQTPDGNIWAGTYGITLHPNTPDAINFNPVNSNYPGNYTTDLAVDLAGKLWATTDNSLSKFTGVNWLNWNINNAPIEYSGFSEIEIAPTGAIWLASSKIYKFDGVNNWQKIDLIPLGMSDNMPRSIALDDESNLWISTWQSGLGKLRTQDLILTPFTQANSPLGTNSIASIAPDHSGGLWVVPNGNGRGILHFSDAWTVSAHVADAAPEVQIQPNPVQDGFTIQLPAGADQVMLSVFNSAGVEVLSQTMEKGAYVDARDLMPGVYFVRVASEGRVFGGKMVKE